jgi:hypothetical protein
MLMSVGAIIMDMRGGFFAIADRSQANDTGRRSIQLPETGLSEVSGTDRLACADKHVQL